MEGKSGRMAALMRRLRPEMNGAVVEAMTARGIVYPLSYGVAVPAIREAAAAFGPDHDLARLLYRQQVRELRLAGIYTADAEQLSPDELDFWARGVVNTEVAEHLAYALLGRTRWAGTVLFRWLGGDGPVPGEPEVARGGGAGLDTPRAECLRYAALMTGAHALARGADGWDYDRLQALLPEACAQAVPAETPAWTAFLGRMIRHAPQGRERVRTFLADPRVAASPLFPRLDDEVSWQLDDTL